MRQLRGNEWLQLKSPDRRSTPEILRVLLASLTDADANWKPAPDRFSIAEVIEHLSHVEGHCFRLRLDQALERDGADWEPYDPEVLAAAGQYLIPEDAAARHGKHRKMGRITVGELVAEWAFHDLGHIRQIAELARARKFYPLMGPFQKQYRINP